MWAITETLLIGYFIECSVTHFKLFEGGLFCFVCFIKYGKKYNCTPRWKKGSLDDELKRLTKLLDRLEEDPIMRMVTALYKDRIRKAKTNMRDRYIVAAKEKDPFQKRPVKP
jgi:hypothetical protein